MSIPFTSFDSPVDTSRFVDLLNYLSNDRSPWAPFLKSNVQYVLKNQSSYTFKVLTTAEFKIEWNKLPKLKDANGKIVNPDEDGNVKGINNRLSGTILLSSYPDLIPISGQVQSRPTTTYLLYALHECVHMVCCPVVPGTQDASARTFVEGGLLEGLVEMVAEDTLSSQGASLPKSASERGHPVKWEIAKELVRATGDIAPFGALLFQNNSTDFVKRMVSVYGKTSNWDMIKHAANVAAIGFVPRMKHVSDVVAGQ